MTKRSADIRASSVTPIMGVERYKPYPAYKDSGVEWLGEIPAHWELKRLKHLTQISSGFTLPESFDKYEGEYPVYGSNGRIGYCDKYLITKQALAIGRVGASGTVNVVPEHTWVSDNALIVRTIGRTPLLWLRYILQAANIGDHAAKNAQPIITATFVGDQPLATPTNCEQQAISAFLDRETARIDTLVAKKERLIELLQEKRTALISRAVTKGLDPDVPLKDSGVEWLGEIPAHWDVKKLKSMVPEVTVGIVVTPSKYYAEDGIPCLRSLNIAQGRVATNDLVFISESANALHKKSQIFNGDVVVVRTGRAGVAVVVPPELNGANCVDLLIIRRSKHLYSQFLYYFINSETVRAQVAADSVGSIQEHYNTGTLSNLRVPSIPTHEQRAIAAFLDHETAQIDALVSKVREAIDRLKELRTALISAAVTGKIDVRKVAA